MATEEPPPLSLAFCSPVFKGVSKRTCIDARIIVGVGVLAEVGVSTGLIR